MSRYNAEYVLLNDKFLFKGGGHLWVLF